MMDCDATQAISFSDEESDETDQETGQRRQVAVLKVLSQKDYPETQQAIFEGENYIGRHDSNSVHLPYKALSKQHACIEVDGDAHLIHDMGSRNRTRRGKMFLKPSVRYQLTDNDVLIFGDVRCQYQFFSEVLQEASDSGSETDSELMFHPPDSETVHSEEENENDSSFNINDVLQPTQAAVDSPKLQFKTPKRVSVGRVFAAESDDDSPNKSSAYGDVSFIPDTQVSAKKKGSVSFVEESDSDTDIEGEGTAHFNVSDIAAAPTQAVENMSTQAIDMAETQAIGNMATQAIDTTQAIDNLETQAIDNMATQAIDPTLAIDNAETQAIGNMSTLAIDNMETQAIDNAETLAIDNMATQAIDNLETQAIDNMSTQAIDNAETQAIGNMSTLAIGNMSTLAIDNMETQAIGSLSSDVAMENAATLPVQYEPDSDTDIDEAGPTLLLEASTASSEQDRTPARQVRNLFDEPTQLCDASISDSDSDTDIDNLEADAETQAVTSNAPHLHIQDDMATVPITTEEEEDDDDETDEENDAPGSKPDGDISNLATIPATTEDDSTDDDEDDVTKRPDNKALLDVENMATVPMAMDEDDSDITDEEADNVAKQTKDKPLLSDIENMATVPMTTDEDDSDITDEEGDNNAKQTKDKPLSSDIENMATIPMATEDDSDTDMSEGEEVDHLSAMQETQALDGDAGIGESGDDDDDDKQVNDEEQEVVREEVGHHDDKQGDDGEPESKSSEPVSGDSRAKRSRDSGDRLGSEEEKRIEGEGKQEGRGKEEQNTEEGGEEEEEEDEIAFTQPYGTSSAENLEEDCYEATQPYGNKEEQVPREMEATQPYGGNLSPPQSPDREDEVAMETEDSEVEATQAYGEQSSDTQVPDSQEESITADMSSRFPLPTNRSPLIGSSRSLAKSAKSPTTSATTARSSTRSPSRSPTMSPTKSCLKPADKLKSAKSPSTSTTAARSSTMSPSRSPAMSPTMSPSKSCLKPADKPGKQAVRSRRVTFESPEDADNQMEECPLEEETLTKRKSKGSTKKAEVKPSYVVKPSARFGRKLVKDKQNKSSNQNEESEDHAEQGPSGRRSSRRAGKETDTDDGDDDEKQNSACKDAEKSKVKGRSRRKVTVQDDETDTKGASLSATGRGKRTRVETDAGPTRKRSLAENKLSSSLIQASKKDNVQDEKQTGSRVSPTSTNEMEQDEKQAESSMSSTLKEEETKKKVKPLAKLKQKLTTIGTRGKTKVGKATGAVTGKGETEEPKTRRSRRVKTQAENDAEANDSDETASLSSTASSMKDLTEVDSVSFPDHRLSIAEPENPRAGRSGRSSRRSARKLDSDFVYETPRASRNRNENNTDEIKPDGRVNVSEEEIAKESVGAEVKSSRKRDRRGVSKDSQGENETLEQTPAPGTRRKDKRGSSKDVESKPEEQEQTPASSTRTSRRGPGTAESQEESSQPKGESTVRQSSRGKKQETVAKELSFQSQDEVTPSKESQKLVQEVEDNIFAVPKPVSRTSRQKKSSESSTVQEPVKKETRSGASASGSQGEAETESQNERTGRGRRSTTAAKTSNKNNQAPGKNSGEAPSSDNVKDAESDSQNERTSRGRRSAAKAKQSTSKKEEATVLASEEESSESNQKEANIELKTPRGRRATATAKTSTQKEEVVAPESTPETVRRGKVAAVLASEGVASESNQKEADTELKTPRGRRATATTKNSTKKEEVLTTEGTPETIRKGKDAAVPYVKEPESTKSRGTRTSKKEQKEEQHLSKQESKPRSKRGAVEEPQASPAKKSRPAPHHTLSPAAAQPTGLATSHLSPSSSPSQASRHRAEAAAAAHSPSLRRRVSEARPRVMFTGVTDEAWMKTVTTLGGELVDSVSDCSHLITDKVRRTVKFLCCVAQGTIIVTPDWLEKSKSSKIFVDPAPYQLQDKAAEKQHGFSLSASLQKAGEGRLFKGYHIHVTAGVKPEPSQMKDIIRCAGGQYANKLPSKANGQQTVVVSCDGDKSLWAGAAKAGVPIVSSEFILTGILQQEVMLAQYKLK